MQKSTQRICIPMMNDEYFMKAVLSTVKDNIDYIPPYGKGTMYVRPISFGISKAISVQPASKYLFIVLISLAYVVEGIRIKIKPVKIRESIIF